MDERIVKVLTTFAKERPIIEAVYLGKSLEKEPRIYFYVSGYRYDSRLQDRIIDLNIALNNQIVTPLMMAISVSPEDAQKQGRLEEIIYKKEKNQ